MGTLANSEDPDEMQHPSEPIWVSTKEFGTNTAYAQKYLV